MHRHPRHAAHRHRRLEMMQVHRLQRHLADHARFARRHLADERGEDRVAPPRDRGDVHESVVFLQIDVAVQLAERRLRLQPLGIDEALDDDLGFRRHQQIDRARAHDVDRRAGKPAGDRDLVEVQRQLGDRGIGDHRRAAEHDAAGQGLAARLVFLPMHIDAGPDLDRRIHAEPARRLDLPAIVADVLDAGVGIGGDVMRRGEERRVVPARRRNRHRQAVERHARLIERLAFDHDLLAGRVSTIVGGCGEATAFTHAAPISVSGLPKPTR